MKRLFFFMLLMFALGTTLPAYSQGCAVCTSTASQLSAESAKGLNKGIIFLAVLPLALIGTIGIVWYRKHRHY